MTFNLAIREEIIYRFVFFFTVLCILIIWEWLSPRRKVSVSRFKRWPSNLSLAGINSIVVRLIFPGVAILASLLAKKNSWGLFNNIELNTWLKVILSIIILDFILFMQHLAFHKLPIFWSIHKMHHTDLDLDTTTGVRFHPIEIILSMTIKILAVIFFGISVISIIIFEILLNVTSMFNHANVYIPIAVDRYLRLIVVTPDMHRVHHSIIWKETNSNYGFNLPWWDRILKTYRSQPQAGHDKMTIGLTQFRQIKFLTMKWLLVIPFINPRR